MARLKRILVGLEMLLFGLTPLVAAVGLMWLMDGSPRGAWWNLCVVVGGTVEITWLVWNRPWRWTATQWLAFLCIPGMVLAVVWRTSVGMFLVGALVFMVIFVVAMVCDDRSRVRRNERAWRASPYWRVPRTPEERRLNAELQGFTHRPDGDLCKRK